MTKPIDEKRSVDESASPTLTRVQKGKYTIDMQPPATKAIGSAVKIFDTWAKSYPVRVPALFGAIPTQFPGLPEIKAESLRTDLPEARFHHE